MDGTIILVAIIGLTVFYGISELFGRSKHIGKWWSFALLATSLIFGIVAIIASPSAKQEPTEGNTTHKVFGWICIALGGISAFALNPASLGLIVLGFYLIKLSKGEITNNNPKFYFNNSRPQRTNSDNSDNFKSSNSIKETEKSKSPEQDVSDYNKKIESLKKFREDGVFTIEEYQRKLELLNDKKHEAEKRKSLEVLKQTVDYKNLEELLNDGILSREEFELKIDILRNKIHKRKKDESDLKKKKEKKITEEQKIKNKLYFLNQEYKANKISKEGFDRRKKIIENELDILNFEKTTAYKNLHKSYVSGDIHNSVYNSKYDEAFKAFKNRLKDKKQKAKQEKINYRYSAFLFVFIFGYPILLFKILEANRVDAIESTSIVIYYLISFLVIYLIKNIRLKIYSIILLSLILVFFNIDYSKLSSSVSSKKTSVSTNEKQNYKDPKQKKVIANIKTNEGEEAEGEIDDVKFASVKQGPIFPGCQNALDKSKCMILKINEFVRKNFDVGFGSQLDLSGRNRVVVQFTIDKYGNVTEVSAEGPHRSLEDEAIRVIKNLPKMTPGVQNGQNIDMSYDLPINIIIED